MTMPAMLQFQISATVPHTGKRDNRVGGVLSRVLGMLVDASSRSRHLRLKGLLPGSGLLTMPSLFRFLVILGVIGGLAYVAVFSLANFVKLHPREMSITIAPDKFVKQQR
jgi:hypothetical protein